MINNKSLISCDLYGFILITREQNTRVIGQVLIGLDTLLLHKVLGIVVHKSRIAAAFLFQGRSE